MTIVAGVDGSDSALDAVRMAALEALWRDRPLRIVHAFLWPEMRIPLGPSSEGPPDGGLRHDAERILAQAQAVAHDTAPSVKMTAELITGSAVPVLLRAAQDADLVALGDRGLGGFTGLLVGSVAVQLAAHSPVPVLVAKNYRGSLGSVVVGVDGSPHSITALAHAFEEADFRHSPLVAVHTWTGPASTAPGDMLPLVYDLDAVQREEELVLGEALAGFGEQFPDVSVQERVLQGGAAHTLITLSSEAQLVVVGTRGRGGFVGLMLGSVSHQVLHHTHCPVLIIPRKA